mmetsp:Transcript_81011/g.121778  ORF Transcript_81011/g.121778 Transcript_81011/m.121778 type:complete len:80 (+) Transcript_81011:105-344(+)
MNFRVMANNVWGQISSTMVLLVLVLSQAKSHSVHKIMDWALPIIPPAMDMPASTGQDSTTLDAVTFEQKKRGGRRKKEE